MKQVKNRELVKAQKIDQTVPVDAFCTIGYKSTPSGDKCFLGYSCNAQGVSSPEEEDDVLL